MYNRCSQDLTYHNRESEAVIMSTINKTYFQNARVGLFTHYTYATYAEGKGHNWGGTWYSADNSRGAVSAEEAAALFDGEAYAKVAHALGAE